MTIVRGIYKPTPTAMVDGQQRELRVDQFGALIMTRGASDGSVAPSGSATDPSSVTGRGGAALATGQVAVGTTATQIVPARAGRQKVTVTPTNASVYYLGTSTVTTTTGLYVAAGASVTLDTAAAVYAVGAAALTLSFIEFY